ncbi:9292_t:CDS:1, partial [Gigaspora rosea]
FMSEISFFITSDQILEQGTSENHLHHTGFYNRLSTSFFTFKYKFFAPLEIYMQ